MSHSCSSYSRNVVLALFLCCMPTMCLSVQMLYITGGSGGSNDSDDKTVPIIGAAVGGICGAIIVIVMIVIVVYCCCRKDAKKNGMYAYSVRTYMSLLIK